MADAEIKVEDLSIGYGDRVLMEHLNFEVRKGEIFFIMGGSGCGKSTLLKHLIGLFEPKCGRIFIRGATSRTPPNPSAWRSCAASA